MAFVKLCVSFDEGQLEVIRSRAKLSDRKLSSEIRQLLEVALALQTEEIARTLRLFALMKEQEKNKCT